MNRNDLGFKSTTYVSQLSYVFYLKLVACTKKAPLKGLFVRLIDLVDFG